MSRSPSSAVPGEPGATRPAPVVAAPAAGAPVTDGPLGRDMLYRVIGAVAEGPNLDRVLPAIVDLLTDATGCHACFVYLRDDDVLTLRAASRVFSDAVGRVSFTIDEGLCGWVARNDRPAFIRDDAMLDPRMKVVPELQEDRFQSMVAVPLRGHDGVVVGVVVLHTEAPREFDPEVIQFLSHVASLVAGTIENARIHERERRRVDAVIERLTEENLVRDLFDAIASGRVRQLAARARSARIDPDRPHVVVVVEPLAIGDDWESAERIEARLRRSIPGALCDPGTDRLRVLLPLPPEGAGGDDLALLDAALDRIAREEGVVAGRSSVQSRLAVDRASLVEAASAARIARAVAPAGGARAWEALGAYRYLVGVDGGIEPDARHAAAVGLLWEYDERRGSELVLTLERYLADRSVVPTARALSIHANTLRQRLERIEHLTGLTVTDEDLLSLELAIKLHRLRVPERGTDAS